MGGGNKSIRLRVGKRDRERLEMICGVFGLSLSGAARVAIRAACEKLGLEKPTPDDFIKNNSTAK